MELMHITPDKKILVLERIRYADEKPVLLEINRFPESFSFLFGENLNDTSLYDVLQNHNIIFDHSDKTLDIVFASAQEAKILGISKVIHFFESRVQSIILIAHLFKDVSSYVSAINLNLQFKNSGHIYICAQSFILFHGILDKFRENCPIPFFLYMHALNCIFSFEISVFILQRIVDIDVFCMMFFGQFLTAAFASAIFWLVRTRRQGFISSVAAS